MGRIRNYAVALVLASALLFGSASVALATMYQDYDWYSWEGYYNGAIDTTLAITSGQWSSSWYQDYYPAAYWYYQGDGYTYYYPAGYYWRIYWDNYTWYDSGEMNYNGAGSYDWYRLYSHERAHQWGWDHYEGSPSTNAAYYPWIDLCGC